MICFDNGSTEAGEVGRYINGTIGTINAVTRFVLSVSWVNSTCCPGEGWKERRHSGALKGYRKLGARRPLECEQRSDEKKNRWRGVYVFLAVTARLTSGGEGEGQRLRG